MSTPERRSPARHIRLVVLVAMALSLVWLSAAPAGAAQQVHIPIPLPSLPSIPNPTDVCNNKDAPTPASPYGDGSWIVRLSVVDYAIAGGHKAAGGKNSTSSEDPFTNPRVSLESVYGTTPQWFTYDDGCTGRVMAGAGTSLGNIGLELEGALPNWVEALLSAVVDPSSWSSALDEPVAKATAAVAGGVWGPWLGVALIFVAILVMLRAREGRLAGAVTATGWALGVLVVVSWLVQYPVESVRMVDSGVRTAVVDIAGSFDASPAKGSTASSPGDGSSATSAKLAVDHQMDGVVRDTMYRTWLTGVFGDADSRTAKEYGPRLFRDTHFSWSEYDTYRRDPDGAGAKIVKDKQNDFKAVAQAVKGADPVAYSYFTGSHWSQRLSLVVINGLVVAVVCAFLLMSGLAILLAFALVRILVPFAPAAGVVYMMESTRELALGMLKKVVGPLVMGPVYFVVGLVLLRFDGTILTSNLWLVVKIALVFVTTWVAWKLTRPAAYGPRVPGVGAVRRLVMTYLGARLGADAGTKAGLEEAEREHGDVDDQSGSDVMPDVTPYADSSRRRLSLPAPRRSPGRMAGSPGRFTEEPAGTSSIDDENWFEPNHDREDPAYASSGGRHRNAAVSEPPMPDVAPANVDYDDDGNPVFVIYHPAGNRHVPLDDEHDGWQSGSTGAA